MLFIVFNYLLARVDTNDKLHIYMFIIVSVRVCYLVRFGSPG
jgi:hypothetical protein